MSSREPSLQHTFEEMCVVHRLTHLQVAFSPPGPAKPEAGRGTPLASGTSLQTLGPHVLPEPIHQSLLSVFQFPSWDQVRRAKIVGNPVNLRNIWNRRGGLGGHGAQRHHVTCAGVEGQGFLKDRSWQAPCQEMLLAGGWDESGPKVFSPHKVSVLRLES